MAVKLATVRRYEHANKEAARIALSEPQKYPGVMQEWSEMVIQRGGILRCAALFSSSRSTASQPGESTGQDHASAAHVEGPHTCKAAPPASAPRQSNLPL